MNPVNVLPHNSKCEFGKCEFGKSEFGKCEFGKCGKAVSVG